MKTAEELRIDQDELRALIEVRDWLRGDGQNSFIPGEDRRRELRALDAGEKPRHGFNMSITASTYKCGSVACIGGHVSLRMQGRTLSPVMRLTHKQCDRADTYVDELKYANTPLTRLYYPTCIYWYDWERITPAIAAQAIDNFLETGSPRWLMLAEEHGLRRA